MDNTRSSAADRRSSISPSSPKAPSDMGASGRPISLPETNNSYQIITLTVNRDENGYGMKVSGDNPVFVQSVKQGGAAEKAGLHAGDRIVEVNGTNVLSSTHTEVVALIKSSEHVHLKVQHKPGTVKMLPSPGLHSRSLISQNSSRITGPQPVDTEKQFQLQLERERHFRLMIEKEQRYLDLLRNQLAQSPDEKKKAELKQAERNLQKLFGMLQSHIKNNQVEQTVSKDTTDLTPPPLPSTPPPSILPPKSRRNPNGSLLEGTPPPLPKRNRTIETQNNNYFNNINGENEASNIQTNCDDTLAQSTSDNNNLSRMRSSTPKHFGKSLSNPGIGTIIDNVIYSGALTPPPLPPRVPLCPGHDLDGANSINKQMSYPLVATCATIVNNYPPNHTHQRTKSSPESLLALSPSDSTRRLIASESMNDLSQDYDITATPPGTPPPPYPSPLSEVDNCNQVSPCGDDCDESFEEVPLESPVKNLNTQHGCVGRLIANSSPIHAATPQTSQQSIMSMEDDEISELDLSHLEDHGPFKTLSQLWQKENMPYLAVFMNYILLNSDSNSLLFYLITDLYKEGNAKEMRKWAYEIHSCFLVPGAPLGINNVDESIAHEVDTVLQNAYDREEILRKVFWKARHKAKEELTRQLADFQQKRVAGLGTIFGPIDSYLAEVSSDKVGGKEFYESLLLERLDPYFEDFDKVSTDSRKYYTAAALTTVFTRIFGIRPVGHVIDRCPTFVNKEKSLRPKFIGRNRKVNVQGHQFMAQQYYTVIRCSYCHQIIYGISPQGFECSICHINLHRACINLYDDSCPGPINKKGMLKIMDRIRHENRDNRKRFSSNFIQIEKEKRMAEERDIGSEVNESDVKTSNVVTRNPSDRRSEALKEESTKLQDNSSTSRDTDTSSGHNESTVSLPASGHQKRRSHNNINRSESVKEQSEKNRKQRRNISDPLHSTGETVDLDQQHPFHHHSGSSSNSSLSSRSLESPGSNTDAVSDSDLEIEADPPDWKSTLSEEQLSKLHPDEMKRQDVINELFHTERSHVRNLKVLNQIFLKNIIESKALTEQEIKLVFPNLVEILTIHNQFNTIMKNKRKENIVVNEVGDILLGMFDGETGNNFCMAAAKFCENQQLALEFIKEKRKKDSKFGNVLSNCEKNNHCRRLPLQGFIPQEMQRLSKYPLLVERLIVIQEKIESPNKSTEISKLRQTLEKSKEILNRVNEAAKLAYNKSRLEEIKNHLDTVMFDRAEHKSLEEFKNFDLTNYTLIHEGTVTLKRPNKTPLQVHMLLLEEAVILLQKESERFVLKFFHAGNQPLAPIIKIPNVICRTNAADVVTLFLLCNTQNSQMYEIQCRDSREREMWFRYLTEASEPYKIRDGKSRKAERTQDQEELEEDLDQINSEIESSNEPEMTPTSLNPEVDQEQNEEVTTTEEESTKVDGEVNLNSCSTSETGDSVTLKLTPNDWPLVQPSEVQVAVAPVHTAEPVLSNFEKIRRTDEEVIKALAKKEALVADYLSIPREHYQYIAEMASEEAVNKDSLDREPSELVLGLIYQVDQLASLTNESLNVSETDSILASGGKYPTCATNDALVRKNTVPSVPAFKLQNIINILHPQLTSLMALVKHREEEKERLRKELFKLREQLHEKSNLHSCVIDNEETTQPPVQNPTETKDLSNDKETQLE